MKSFAIIFAKSTSQEEKNKLIGLALMSPNLNGFIEKHKDGWLGEEGNFARVLSRVLQSIN